MKQIISLSLVFVLLCGFKDGPAVNFKFLGKYKNLDTVNKKQTIWIVTQNAKSPDKIDFKRPVDASPLFTAIMIDDTHFKTKHDFTEHVNSEIDLVRTCTGVFSEGEMLLVIQYENRTYGGRNVHVSHSVTNMNFKKMPDTETKPQSKDNGEK